MPTAIADDYLSKKRVTEPFTLTIIDAGVAKALPPIQASDDSLERKDCQNVTLVLSTHYIR